MKAQWKRSIIWLGCCIFMLGIMGGCMTERAPVDKTDPLALDKKLFEGEFFFKQTVTDVPMEVEYTFIGETNELKIIRWEITENWLIGYNVHEKIETVDTEGNMVHNDPAVITLPIKKHFDALLMEDATTGEDLPVLVENYDKPWYQRRYFVIDPSGNVDMNIDLQYLRIQSELDNPYTVRGSKGYYALEFHDKSDKAINPRDYEFRHMAGGDQLVNTMSFQVDMSIQPNNGWNYWWTWEDFDEYITYQPQNIKFRNFFQRVDREKLSSNGFITREYQDPVFRRFGYFTRKYRGFDPYYGYNESQIHEWATYYNTTGENQIHYYLSPNMPERYVLAACSIAADYNHAFSKAQYDSMKAQEAYEAAVAKASGSGEPLDFKGFDSDFPDQIRLQDGLYQVAAGGASPSSLFLRDATTPWPEDLYLKPTTDDYEAASSYLDKLKYRNYFYLDPNVEIQKAPPTWEDADKSKFSDRQSKIIAAMKEYCFNPKPTDKFVLHRNEFLEYDYDRDGVNPEGMPNLLTPAEIKAQYGDDIASRVSRTPDYPVACEQTVEHRCKLNSNGDKIARWKAENGDLRYSFMFYIEKPIGASFLGVAQWVDNPETGQTMSASAHVAGAVLDWVAARDLEFFYLNKESMDPNKINQEDGLPSPTAEQYKQMVYDIVVDPEYYRIPIPGEETQRGDNTHFKSRNTVNTTMAMSAPKHGSTQWKMSALYNQEAFSAKNTSLNSQTKQNGITEVSKLDKLRLYKEKHLPQIRMRDMSVIKGTKWESYMTPGSLLDMTYPDATAYDEDMLSGLSPLYWGTPQALNRLKAKENLFGRKCYYQAEWLDSGILQLIENLDHAGYSKDDIFHAIRLLSFKGTVEHEVGHTVGFRHNFEGSSDEMNFRGGFMKNADGELVKWGYEKANEDFQTQLNALVADYKDKHNGLEPTPHIKHLLSKTIASERDFYMYSSIMDYQENFYDVAFGLGKYDYAAILYTYGGAVEKYKTNGNQVVLNKFDAPEFTIWPLYETRYCSDQDFENGLCGCKEGDPNCVCTAKVGGVNCYNSAKKIGKLREEIQEEVVTTDDGVMRVLPVNGGRVSAQLNGNNRPYSYCPDEYVWEHPMCKRFDKGISGREIVRNWADFHRRRYFYRFFRRGNPKFSEFSRTFFRSISDMYYFVHYATDLNFNKFQISSWQNAITDNATNPFAPGISRERKEYLLALQGIEEWTDPATQKADALTPFGPGDYLVAAMEGYNYLTYDVLYSPDVGKHVQLNYVDQPEKTYYRLNPYIYSDDKIEDMLGVPTIDIDLRYGRFHKTMWDYQDDYSIDRPRMQRLGFTREKDAAAFCLDATLWGSFNNKYGFESMANGYGYLADGFDRSYYHMMKDMVGVDGMTTFSRYCVREELVGTKTVPKLVVVEPMINNLYLWNSDDGESFLKAVDINKNLCEAQYKKEMAVWQEAGSNPDTKPNPLTPIHASWIYFDRMYPLFQALTNQSNTMADNTIWQYYYAEYVSANFRLAGCEDGMVNCDNYKDIDYSLPEDQWTEVEALNSKENYYIRARRVLDDPRPNPIFDLVKRYRALQNICLKDATKGQVPGNFVPMNPPSDAPLSEAYYCISGGTAYPRWYMSRTLEEMESTIILLQDFAGFWMGISQYVDFFPNP